MSRFNFGSKNVTFFEFEQTLALPQYCSGNQLSCYVLIHLSSLFSFLFLLVTSVRSYCTCQNMHVCIVLVHEIHNVKLVSGQRGCNMFCLFFCLTVYDPVLLFLHSAVPLKLLPCDYFFCLPGQHVSLMCPLHSPPPSVKLFYCLTAPEVTVTV